jgi:APA family basic amino acid/polyamine antiporter
MADVVGQGDQSGGGLPRRLGLTSATALVVAEVIGVGIFLTPAGMARSLGSPAWLLAVWLVTGAAALAGALCFGSLAARFPEAGGGYVYLREAFGPRVAFLYGWLSMLVTDPGLTALFAVGMAESFGPQAGLSQTGMKAVAVGAVLSLSAVNVLGATIGAGLLRALTVLKLGSLALMVVWGVGLGRGDWSNLVPFVAQRPGSEPLGQALPGALIAAFFSFGGWWDTSKVAGEVRDPARNVPHALTLGVGLVTAAYVVISLVFFYLVPTSRITSDRAFAALAGEALFGKAGSWVFTAVVVTSVAGSLAAILMAAPRVYFAMARDGLFFPAVAAVHPRFRTPARAVAIQALLASALVATGSFEEILAYFFFVTVAFLVLTVAGVYVLGQAPGTSRIPGYPLTPLAFLVPVGLVLVLLLVGRPKQSLLGLGVVALGLPVSWLLVPRRSRLREYPPEPPDAVPSG